MSPDSDHQVRMLRSIMGKVMATRSVQANARSEYQSHAWQLDKHGKQCIEEGQMPGVPENKESTRFVQLVNDYCNALSR